MISKFPISSGISDFSFLNTKNGTNFWSSQKAIAKTYFRREKQLHIHVIIQTFLFLSKSCNSGNFAEGHRTSVTFRVYPTEAFECFFGSSLILRKFWDLMEILEASSGNFWNFWNYFGLFLSTVSYCRGSQNISWRIVELHS